MGDLTMVDPAPGNKKDEVERAISRYANFVASFLGEETVFGDEGELKGWVRDDLLGIVAEEGSKLTDANLQEVWMRRAAEALENGLGEPPGLRNRVYNYFSDPGLGECSFNAWKRRNS